MTVEVQRVAARTLGSPPRPGSSSSTTASIDVPLALGILALGIVVAAAPSSIPSLVPTM